MLLQYTIICCCRLLVNVLVVLVAIGADVISELDVDVVAFVLLVFAIVVVDIVSSSHGGLIN